MAAHLLGSNLAPDSIADQTVITANDVHFCKQAPIGNLSPKRILDAVFVPAKLQVCDGKVQYHYKDAIGVWELEPRLYQTQKPKAPTFNQNFLVPALGKYANPRLAGDTAKGLAQVIEFANLKFNETPQNQKGTFDMVGAVSDMTDVVFVHIFWTGNFLQVTISPLEPLSENLALLQKTIFKNA